jgi:hypothetical protein
MNRRVICSLFTLGAVCALQSRAEATEHLMQIEQIIGSVNGDTTAQAIQLRMRANNQQFVSGGKLVVFDAAGSNPVEVLDLESNVAIGVTGARVLIASATFPGPVPDFVMDNIIPESYLAAGSLVWENDAGTTIWWRTSWGGAAYTGSNLGSTNNDVDGDFGPPFPTGLPTCGVYALLFTGAANARSVTNAGDYRLTTEQSATFTNNAGGSAVVSGTLPTVRVQTIDNVASEVPANDTGRLRVTRTGCTEVALTASYALSGTATNRIDYRRLPGTLGIPVGATNAIITVRAVNDALPEPDETAIVTLSPDVSYTIGSPPGGTVTIRSDE